jgi:hypothetical protein
VNHVIFCLLCNRLNILKFIARPIALISLMRAHPTSNLVFQTRLVLKYKHSNCLLSLKVTDDKQVCRH